MPRAAWAPSSYIGLGDDPTIDRLDDAARTLVRARGPIGSADLVTVFAVQVGILADLIAGPHSDPETVYTDLVREHVARARQQRNTSEYPAAALTPRARWGTDGMQTAG
ncbi:hypothetical protein [Streptomyces broussonetiae]|uniref:hypothetical protein n=1 Tax=Streptomyces broussonetiae TaxID=2686304 RepID=UPI0035E1859C